MRSLIEEVRATLPLELSPDDVCFDECKNCSIKLIEYIAMELENWEDRLDGGEIPNFGELNKLARTSKKIYRALQKNGLIDEKAQIN